MIKDVQKTKHPIRSQTMMAHWILFGIILLSFLILLWGIQRDLPYTYDFDEPIYVERAIRMASSGNLNPEWFGNPGSTTIYPLVAIYHLWNAATHQGMFFHADPNLQIRFTTSFWEFYLLGRLLSVAYSVMALPLIYLLGEEIFGTKTGLVGALFFSLYSWVIFYSRMVRTDSAAVFFGLLSLWLLIKTYKRPTTINQLLTGLFIGLSIASRYFMVALAPMLLIMDGMILWQQKSKVPGKTLLAQIIIGASAVGAGFAISTPYFFLDFEAVFQSILIEARNTALGFDGLSPLENFMWYITHAIPEIMTWPQTGLLVMGVVLALKKRQFSQLLLLGFVVVFMIGICSSPLHWYRWLIQILPIFALFAAYALTEITKKMSHRSIQRQRVQRIVFILGVSLVLVWPVYKVISLNLKAGNHSTRVVAREWMLENLSLDSPIALEAYTAPLNDTGFVKFESWALAYSDYTLDDLYQHGYRYVVVSSVIYDRFSAEPDRYAAELDFYHILYDKGELVQKFEPSLTRGGPTIQIFELPES